MEKSLKIFGLFGTSNIHRKRMNLPENFKITGYITNLGQRFSVNLNDESGFFMSESGFLTEDELKIYIKKYQRKEKLEKIKKF